MDGFGDFCFALEQGEDGVGLWIHDLTASFLGVLASRQSCMGLVLESFAFPPLKDITFRCRT
jgi:hypothetical protein